MPANAFIRFESYAGELIPGESQQLGHKGIDGWIEISEWSWDVEAESSHDKGTGAAIGKPKPGTLSFSHFYDKSSPTLMRYFVQGTHFRNARIDMLKQTGLDMPELYFQLSAKDVFISKVANKGAEDGTVNQDVEFVFKEVAIGYKRQNNDGKLDAVLKFNWNVADMTQLTPKLTVTIV